MTMPFDQLLRRTDIWLACLDRERDLAIRQIKQEGRKPHLLAWLDSLDAERVKHTRLIDELEVIRKANHPMLLLPVRPSRMVKSELLKPSIARREA